MTHAEIAFVFIIGAISALGMIWSAVLTSRASDRAARSAHEAMEHQTKLNAKAKIAEFRQAWINNLRNEMARVMAFGYEEDHLTTKDAIEAVAKVFLLMNRRDPRYDRLSSSMNQYVKAMKAKDTGHSTSELMTLCQDILKDEWEVLKRELLELKSTS